MVNKIIPLTITMEFDGIPNTIHPTLLWSGEHIILVDCGFIGSLPLLEKELRLHGVSVRQITGLVLTHHDHDHMGAAAELKRANPGIQILSSAQEAPYISAEKTPLRLLQAEEMQKTLPPELQAFGQSFCEMLRRVEPVPVDRVLHDGEELGWCGGCKVMATPGHTPGHISLFLEKSSVVITGDAFVMENGQPAIANPQFVLNMEQAAASMDKLLSLKAATYYCYHSDADTRRTDDVSD